MTTAPALFPHLVSEAARVAYRVGLIVIPPKEDGTKAPDIHSWRNYNRNQRRLLQEWFNPRTRTGIGIRTGVNNLECIDFDSRDAYGLFRKHAESHGLSDVIERIEAGYLEYTPKGVHWFYYCDEIGPNTKLAKLDKQTTLIETRGIGGYVVIAPSHGLVHPSGEAYTRKRGSLATIATITADEREDLFAVARMLDQEPKREAVQRQRVAGEVLRPGDDFNERGPEWQAILEPHGWAFVGVDREGVARWRRPGKDTGISATTNYRGSDRLYVFTTSTAFEAETSYSKFAAYAVLNHEGDYKAAAAQLATQGYGETDTEGSPVLPNLPEDFWSSRAVLGHIRQAAHSRAASADAVLGAVLARLAALVPHKLRMDTGIGSSASLNLIVSPIGPSGAGKTLSMACAYDLLPVRDETLDIADRLPLGSGEGLAEAYMGIRELERKQKVRVQVRNNAFFYQDEGEALTKMLERSGATIGTALRTAWSGSDLGQQNAHAERVRHVKNYSFGAVIGFQVSTAVPLLDDAKGGTPQRFTFLSAADPSIPDVAPDWPGPLPWEPPVFDDDLLYELGDTIIQFPDEAKEIMRKELLAVTRDGNARPELDSHARLMQAKLAALLAVLDGRTDAVSMQDWRLAEVIVDTSKAVRSVIVEARKNEMASKEQAAIQRAARRQAALDDDAEARAYAKAGRAIVRHVSKHGEACTKRCISRAVASRDRVLINVDELLSRLTSRGELFETDPGKFRAYKSG